MTSERFIYLNACGLGLPDPACAEAMAHQALRPAGRLDEEARLRHRARQACARLLRTDPAKVGLGSGTFQLWTAVMARLPVRRGRILVAAHEWGDHVRWLQHLAANTDVRIDVVPAGSGEAFDPNAWAARIDQDVIALCLPLVTSVEGLGYPAREIAAVPRPDDAVVVVDAAQALGRIVVDPDKLGCDVLVGTTRKWLRGPRQTALFWLSERASRVLQAPPSEIEPFDLNAALLAGLTRAIEVLDTRTLAQVSAELQQHDARLRAGLTGAPDVRLHPPGTVGTLTCSVPHQARPDLDARLSTLGVVAKWCNASRDEPLSGAATELSRLRLSPHVYNQDDDIDLAIRALSPRH